MHLEAGIAMREVNLVVSEMVEPYRDVAEVQVFIGHWRKALTHESHRNRSRVNEVVAADRDVLVGVIAEAIALTYLLTQLDPGNAEALEQHRETLRAHLAKLD